jgi:hypothetical protein
MHKLPGYKEILLSFKEILHDKRRVLLLLIILFGSIEPFLFPSSANAVVTGFLRTDRMGSSVATGGTVCMTPATTGTEAKVVVTFPATGATADATHYGVNQTAGNWTVTTTNIPTGSTAWPTIATATTASGGSVTFGGGDLTVGTQYCFNFTGTSTLSTPTAANNNLTGTIQTQTSGNSPIDTVNFALSNVTSNNDQIVVTASVASTFSFALSGNTAALGTLTTSGAPNTASAITMTISTNALNGWLAWAKNTNATSSLVSAAASDGICFGGNYPTCTGAAYQTGSGNVHSLSSAAGYGLSVAAGSGTPTVATEYAGSSTSFGSLDNTKFEQIASKNAPVTASTATLTFGAEASATNKPATDYTDTVTISAAGQF